MLLIEAVHLSLLEEHRRVRSNPNTSSSNEEELQYEDNSLQTSTTTASSGMCVCLYVASQPSCYRSIYSCCLFMYCCCCCFCFNCYCYCSLSLSYSFSKIRLDQNIHVITTQCHYTFCVLLLSQLLLNNCQKNLFLLGKV